MLVGGCCCFDLRESNARSQQQSCTGLAPTGQLTFQEHAFHLQSCVRSSSMSPVVGPTATLTENLASHFIQPSTTPHSLRTSCFSSFGFSLVRCLMEFDSIKQHFSFAVGRMMASLNTFSVFQGVAIAADATWRVRTPRIFLSCVRTSSLCICEIAFAPLVPKPSLAS